jgi:enoyl-CoA hydratase
VEIELTVDSGVANLTLSAPQRRNALTPEMSRELVAAADRVDADDSVGALVIRGAGGSFCAGAHTTTLGDAGSDPAEENTFANLSAIYAAFTRIGSVRAVTIAAVRGPAVGAGLNLALATDLRIVARNARLLSGFQRIGLHPGGGHFVLLSRLAGREAAAAMALCGAEIDGDRAVQLGLAWESVDDENVEARALELAREAAKDAALARAMARTFRLETGPPALGWDAAVQTERAPQMWSMRRR